MKLLIALFLTAGFAQSKIDKTVVAEVNGKKITKNMLMRYHSKNLNFVRANRKVTVESSLNDLINRIVGIEKGKKNKLHKSPNVIKKMNDIIYHAQISKDLDPKFRKIGKIEDSEVATYCKQNPEYRTSQILHRLRTNPSKKDVAEALEQSLSVYKELQKNPDNFAEMAKVLSQTTNAKIGGDLGFQPKTKLTPEFYAAIKGKKVGFITKPFRSQYGVHIAKVTGIKDCKDVNKSLYKKIIYDIKRDKIMEKYFSDMRAKAKVKIYKNKI
ncbi:MAG: peptidylprolyl isomerase [Bacteriovoracaceae bacterium]|jgi:peptidyl-prolyl cis-trans isomerase C|nr:peptidylprolyl isomerase [Bacteriovoracaceae bacterium]